MSVKQNLEFTIKAQKFPFLEGSGRITRTAKTFSESFGSGNPGEIMPVVRCVVTQLELDMENRSFLGLVKREYVAELLTNYGRLSATTGEAREYVTKEFLKQLAPKLGYFVE